jgi:hypothetical protein
MRWSEHMLAVDLIAVAATPGEWEDELGCLGAGSLQWRISAEDSIKL